MPSPEAALIAALKADPGVSALAGDRVFVAGAQQNAAYPYIAVQRISTAGAAIINGPATLQWPRFQIDSWDKTALGALNTAEAVRLAIDNVTITGSPTITATFQDQRGPAPDEATRNFGVSQDFFLYHER